MSGTGYLLTANEGDARDYSGFSEQVRLGSNNYLLDPTAFPNTNLLKNSNVLGRPNVTNKLGDTDGDFDEIYSHGSRSCSIYNATTGTEVYDSGNLLERVTAADATYGVIFNASNGFGEAPTRKSRSDDKGPKPKGVTTGRLGTDLYGWRDDVPDLLALSYSSPDAVGHTFGPLSKEENDLYLCLDLELARLLQALDKTVGKGNYAVFLTADHGASEVTRYLADHQLPVGTFDRRAVYQATGAYLAEQLGPRQWLEAERNNMHYLNRPLIAQHKLELARRCWRRSCASSPAWRRSIPLPSYSTPAQLHHLPRK